MNVVAYKTTEKPHATHHKFHQRAKREAVLEAFAGFGKTVTTVLGDLAPPELDIVGNPLALQPFVLILLVGNF